jgi:hypothetical protein
MCCRYQTSLSWNVLDLQRPLHACQTWSLNLTDRHELQMSANKVLKKILRFYYLHTAEQQLSPP